MQSAPTYPWGTRGGGIPPSQTVNMLYKMIIIPKGQFSQKIANIVKNSIFILMFNQGYSTVSQYFSTISIFPPNREKIKQCVTIFLNMENNVFQKFHKNFFESFQKFSGVVRGGIPPYPQEANQKMYPEPKFQLSHRSAGINLEFLASSIPLYAVK